MKHLLVTLLIASVSLSATARWGQGGEQQSSQLTVGEEEHLVFMREEEKLARDVYTTFSQMYPSSPTFGRIDDSEQKHTDAVKRLLDKYGVEDPSTNDNVGVFTGAKYGAYFTEKYNELVARGSVSELEALYVGAFIEELDMIDIVQCNQVIIDANPELNSADDCGLNSTTTRPIQRTLSNLLAGSENHLWAYVNRIEKIIGAGNYKPQLLTQEELDEILDR